MRVQNAFPVTHVPSISRLELIEHIYSEISDVKAYSKSKQAVVSASDVIETTYHYVRIFMQLRQCFVFIWHLDDM